MYTREWLRLRAASVVAVDSSNGILQSARDLIGDHPHVRFHLGDALSTNLPESSADVVFARALVHHLADLEAFVCEASRLLRPGACSSFKIEQWKTSNSREAPRIREATSLRYTRNYWPRKSRAAPVTNRPSPQQAPQVCCQGRR